MPTYVSLYKLTEQGRQNIKTLADRMDQAKSEADQRGFKILGQYVTMGEYDLVTVVEAPDDIAAARAAAGILARGNVTSATMRAFTPEEFRQATEGM